MTTAELSEATRQFDDPTFHPPAIKPTSRQRAQLRRWQRARSTRHATVAVSLERKLIEQADDYAVSHGITFSDLVSTALRRALRRRSA